MSIALIVVIAFLIVSGILAAQRNDWSSTNFTLWAIALMMLFKVSGLA